MAASADYRRFVGSVYGVARRLVTRYQAFPEFRTAVIVEAQRLGKRRVSYATRLQVAKSVAQQVWDEPGNELHGLDNNQLSFMEVLRSEPSQREQGSE